MPAKLTRRGSCSRPRQSLLLTLYGLVLSRYASSSRFVINVLYAMRHPVHPDVQRVVGNFTSSILFEFNGETTDDASLGAAVLNTLDQLWSDLDHSHFDGVSVMQEVNRQSKQTFQAVAPFAFVSTLGLALPSEAGQADSGAAYREYGVRPIFSCVQTPQTLIDHQLEEIDGCLVYSFDIVTRAFPSSVIDGILSSYRTLLGALAQNVGSWDFAANDLVHERSPIAPIAPSLASPVPNLLHDRAVSRGLDARARASVAVVDASCGIRLSYAQLEAASRRVAHALLDVGVRPSGDSWHREAWGERTHAQQPVVVAVSCDRSWEQVAGVIGVLRASCVYVPIDPRTPRMRASQLLSLSDA